MARNGDRRRRDGRRVGRIQRGLEVRAGWWDRVVELPLVWGALAVVVCTWLLLPSPEIEVPQWKAGEIAAYDVLIPSDVTLPDETATEGLRTEARTSVPPVYDLEPRLADGLIQGVHRMMSTCREQIAESGEIDGDGLSAASDLVVQPAAIRVLRASKCSEELESTLIEVGRQLYSAGIVDDQRLLEKQGEHGIILRNLATGRERLASLVELGSLVDARNGAGTAARALLLEHDTVRRRWLGAMSAFLADNLLPNIVFNRAETAARRDQAAGEVTERVQVLRRGQVLVRRGDRVTPAVERTLALLAAKTSDWDRLAVGAGIGLLVLLVALGWWRVLGTQYVGSEGRYRLSAVFILMMIFVGIDRLALFLGNAVALASQGAAAGRADAYLWALPHAAGPLVASLLLGGPAAVLFAVFEALGSGILLGGSFTAVPYALAGGLVAVMASRKVRESSALTRVGLMVGVTEVVLYVVLKLYVGTGAAMSALLLGAFFAFISGPLSSALAGFVIPLLERVFGITTDLRLVELSSQNLPLLRRLAAEAPGSFQHSLAVGHLAETGAEAVGANGLLLRVCSYYHDIGKLVKPQYFVENQRGTNPHDTLSPSMSALILQSHVKEGLELARKARLPLPVRQAIATHHGTKLIRYFYSRAQEEAEKKGGPPIQEAEFRYPGPRPHTKELGILLLADAVEAASRTLENPTPSRIQSMIDTIFTDALKDDQLDESELTFSELEKVGSAFLWVLANTYHARIDYPGFDFNRKVRKHESGAARMAKTPDKAGR